MADKEKSPDKGGTPNPETLKLNRADWEATDTDKQAAADDHGFYLGIARGVGVVLILFFTIAMGAGL